MFDFLKGIIIHWLTTRAFHLPEADIADIATVIGVTPAKVEKAEELFIQAVVNAIVKEI